MFRSLAEIRNPKNIIEMTDLFVLLKPSPDWMRPIYTMEDNLLYTKLSDPKAPSQKHPE